MSRNIRQLYWGFGLLLSAVLLMVAWVFFNWLVSLLVDAAWFKSLDFGDVFWKALKTQFLLFIPGAFFCGAFLWLNLRFSDATFVEPDRQTASRIPFYLDPLQLRNISRRCLTGLCFCVAVFFGISFAHQWQNYLMWNNRMDFGVQDPIFGLDASFYVFSLPFVQFLLRTVLVLLGTAAVIVFVHYAAVFEISLESTSPSIGRRSFRHLSFLGVIALIAIIFRFQLQKYTLLYTQTDTCSGPGYVEVHALIPALTFMQILTGVFVIWLIVNGVVYIRPANVYFFIGFTFVWLFATKLYPATFHSLVVKPNEYERESLFIEHSINFTRMSYGLDTIQEIPWEGDRQLTHSIVSEQGGTLGNILLWDGVSMREVLQQKQRIRSYYDLSEVDVDRYEVDGTLRPVIVSVRELDASLLPEEARVWTNMRLQYTHGYGMCIAYANRSTENGLPEFLISNIPPQCHPEFFVAEPRIYFGERTAAYALVKTKLDEFDYPGDIDNFFTQYYADSGIPVSGFFSRLLLALYTGDKEIVFTKQLKDDSRILLYRHIRQRLLRIAPFLSFDDDPYPILSGGKIFWVVDGYTLTDRFPYAESIGRTNYLRNPVKAVVDAYDGSVTLYVIDESEPILKVWREAFPGIFKKSDEMPEDIRKHIRYPKDLFRVQTVVYRRYHVTDPQVFFNREDVWTFPRDSDASHDAFESPRYLVMELPDSGRGQEFILARSFTVEGKDNMIAWIAGGCDGDRYGKLTVYRMPKGRNIYGPVQMRGRFNQDPDVSAFNTLMGQIGSTVRNTAVLPIPIANSILYVQSLFVVDPDVRIPELKQVIVGQGDRVAMAPSLPLSLEKLFESHHEITQSLPDGENDFENVTSWDDALALYREANQRVRAGDWSGFGEAFERLGRLLSERSDKRP